MNVDFSACMKNMDGSEAKIDGASMTLGVVAALALNTPGSSNSVQRGVLAMRLYGAQGDVEITPEEASLIRDGLSSVWPPIIVAQAHQLLG